MNDQSLSHHCIRLRMGKILKAITGDSEFQPNSVVHGFKDWVELSGMSKIDKEVVAKTSFEVLNEIERRVRWVRQELKDDAFRNL